MLPHERSGTNGSARWSSLSSTGLYLQALAHRPCKTHGVVLAERRHSTLYCAVTGQPPPPPPPPHTHLFLLDQDFIFVIDTCDLVIQVIQRFVCSLSTVSRQRELG